MLEKISVFILVLYLTIVQLSSVYANEFENEHENMENTEEYAEFSYDYYETGVEFPLLSEYTSGAVVLMDADSGLVLYGNNAHTPKYPASITKVMTALVVLEQIYDLQERIEFSDRAVFSIPRNSSHISMDVGETLTVEEALYGLMLSSANEVSMALAEHVAGSVEGFVDLMNRRAMGLGATRTHFANPSGLPAPGHITTAYDMALIMRAAIQHDDFRRIISARRFDIPPTERQPLFRELLNTNRMIQPGQFFNEKVVGGKTGWTSDAQHTLVTYAEHEGRRLVVSVLQAESAGTFNDTNTLLAFGFALPFDEVVIFDSADYALTIPVYQEINGNLTEIGRVPILADRDLTMYLPHELDPTWLRYELSVPETLSPPVRVGDEVGGVIVYVQNIRVDEVILTAQEEVLSYSPSPYPVEENIYGQTIYGHALDYYGETVAPWMDDYILTLAVPIAVSVITLIISVVIYLTRRKRRMRRMLHARYARYPEYYRYR